MSKPQLVIFEPDAQAAELLRLDFDLPFVLVMQGNGKQATAAAHLDAIWLTWMQAEQFGITPQLDTHLAIVGPTPDAMVQKGFAPLTVAGVSFAKGDSADPAERLRISLEAIFGAIERFENSGGGVIERLGTLPENLLLGKLPAARVSELLRATWERSSE